MCVLSLPGLIYVNVGKMIMRGAFLLLFKMHFWCLCMLGIYCNGVVCLFVAQLAISVCIEKVTSTENHYCSSSMLLLEMIMMLS